MGLVGFLYNNMGTYNIALYGSGRFLVYNKRCMGLVGFLYDKMGTYNIALTRWGTYNIALWIWVGFLSGRFLV